MKTIPIRVYDNGGVTIDRYTVVYMDERESSGLYACRGMDARPFHPQGFGQMSSAQIGPHLGKRIRLTDLPRDCQRAVLQDCGASVNSTERVYVSDGLPKGRDYR